MGNMPPRRIIDRYLDAARIDAFGAEIDALRQRMRTELGQADADYLQRIVALQRRLEIAGRGSLYLGVMNPLAWAAGVGLLAVAKILDNMEIGHNVLHGQYDWMGDPLLNSRRFEWETLCPAQHWRLSHNYLHHHFTNVIGRDRDIGYGGLRMAADQPWHWRYLGQPVLALGLFVGFEWGVGLHHLELDQIVERRWRWADHGQAAREVAAKGWRLLARDYVVFPALAGPFFLPVLLGNLSANVLRNMWTFTIIFCGHFPAGVLHFPAADCDGETRAEWYLRQLLGSCNIRGGRWFQILNGHLGYQIEHHLFPDLPAWRYPALAREVEAICARYGLPYNTGSLRQQFGSTVARIVAFSLPPRSAWFPQRHPRWPRLALASWPRLPVWRRRTTPAAPLAA